MSAFSDVRKMLVVCHSEMKNDLSSFADTYVMCNREEGCLIHKQFNIRRKTAARSLK